MVSVNMFHAAFIFTLIKMIGGATVHFTLYIDHAFPYKKSNKPVVTANYTSPGPKLEANLGDTMVIRVINKLNVSTTLHWHGLQQKNTPDMDGAPGATQCAISPGAEFTYKFTAEPAGTAWYHGHLLQQYADGLFGPIIIHRPPAQSPDPCLDERIVMMTDWYNLPASKKLESWYLSRKNHEGIEPIPDAIAVNGIFTHSLFFQTSGSSRICFRMINAASLSMFSISIDGFPLNIIEVDQTSTKPYKVESFLINIAQRVSFYIDMKDLHSHYGTYESPTTPAVYFRVEALSSMYAVDILSYLPPTSVQKYAYPTFLNTMYLAVLSFTPNDSRPNYGASDDVPSLSNVNSKPDTNILAARPFDDTNYTVPSSTHTLTLKISFNTDSKGINRGYINGITYRTTTNLTTAKSGTVGIVSPSQTPLLFQMVQRPNDLGLLKPTLRKNTGLPEIQGDQYGNYLIPYGAVVDIFINNTDNGEHPFHLHGYNFWIIATSDYPEAETLYKNKYIRRDVVSIPASGWAKIRYAADNPGVWLFHCHIEWHLDAGLMIAFIIGTDELNAQGFKISKEDNALCLSSG